MNLINKFKDSCRLCNGTKLKKILTLPSSQPVDNFRTVLSEYLELPRFSMDLYQCQNCSHTQLLNVVDPNILFGNYIYESSSSPDLYLHFKNYSEFLFKFGYLRENDTLLDIGSNDGLFLDFNKKLGAKTYGVDPAKEVSEICIKKGHNVVCDFLNENSTKKLMKKNSTYKVITANNVFSHSDNLIDMRDCISLLLNKNGYYIFEVSYLLDTVCNGVIDYIYHEHLSYHSVKSLVPFLSEAQLYIYDIVRISTKGGSIRIICGKDSNKENRELIEDMISVEEKADLYNIENYNKIQSKLFKSKKLVQNWLNDNYEKNFIGYGASATGTVLSSILGVDDYLSAIVDDNIQRQKLLAPNSFVPIVSVDELKDKKNVCFLILAWRFSDQIINKIKKNFNGSTIVVLEPLIDEIKEIKF